MIPIPQQPLAIPYPMSNIPSNEQIRTALDNEYAYAKTVQGCVGFLKDRTSNARD